MKGSQNKIAALVGVTPAAISRYKAGHIRPQYLVAKRLAEITGSSVEFWMEGAPDEIAAVLDAWEPAGGDKSAAEGGI